MALAADYLDSAGPLSVGDVQIIYQVIMEDFRDHDLALIAVGIAFGETIAAKAGWEWVRVTDEYGSETSLGPAGYNITCHPISMIQKRIQDGVSVEIEELRDETIAHIQRRIADGWVGVRRH